MIHLLGLSRSWEVLLSLYSPAFSQIYSLHDLQAFHSQQTSSSCHTQGQYTWSQLINGQVPAVEYSSCLTTCCVPGTVLGAGHRFQKFFLIFTAVLQSRPYHCFTDEKSEAWSSSLSCPSTATQPVWCYLGFPLDLCGSGTHTLYATQCCLCLQISLKL